MIETLGWYVWSLLSWLRRNEYDGPDGSIECPTCKGTGTQIIPDLETDWDIHCETCGGTGWYYIPTHQEMG